MVPDPDNQMDELLKAYAKKRREQAGAPLEMHPATRNLLHAEAAKLAPKGSRSAGGGLDWLRIFWPRVAFALCVFIALAIGTWAHFRTESGRMELSKLEVKKERAARSRDQGNTMDLTETLQRSPTQSSAGGKRVAETSKTATEREAQPGLITRRPQSASETVKDGDAVPPQSEALLKRRSDLSAELKQRYGLDRETKPAPTMASAAPSTVVTLKAEQTSTAPQGVATSTPAARANAKEVTNLSSQTRLDAGRGGANTRSAAAPSGAVPASGTRGAQPPRGLAGAGGLAGGARGGRGAGDERASSTPLPSTASQLGVNADGLRPTTTLQLRSAGKDLAVAEQAKADATRRSLSAPRDAYSVTSNSGSRQSPATVTNPSLAQGNVANGRSPSGPQPAAIGVASAEVAGTTDALAKTTTLYARGVANAPVAETQWSAPVVRYRMTNQIAAARTEAYYFAAPESLRQPQDAAADKPQADLAQTVRARFEAGVKANVDEKRETPSAVLSSFDIEQTADRIRITDADGSVYDVRFFAAVPAPENQVKAQVSRRYAVTLAEVDEARTGFGTSPPVQNFSFEAAGTNRSLNQWVTITGIWSGTGTVAEQKNLAPTAAASARALSYSRNESVPLSRTETSLPKLPGVAGGAIGSLMTVQASPPLPAHIRAKARIGTNEIEINAVRVSP